MSTTDIKAILEAWAKSEGLIHESHGVIAVSSTYDISRKAFYAGYQAATEAAKATGTAELPKWIDNQKGKDPLIDDLIHYIETLLKRGSTT